MRRDETPDRSLSSGPIDQRCRARQLNALVWLAGTPRLHEVNLFSAGFVLGMVGMYISAWVIAGSPDRVSNRSAVGRSVGSYWSTRNGAVASAVLVHRGSCPL
jgi:hypothetical protein